MIRKILIANRGEIALRIVRACRELGIQTLAVYSEADEQSLHVQLADEAICIGPAIGSESYLRADRILSAAEVADVDAIHPGYGFLSENAEFAEQCASCNINFIGPKAETIGKMGDKAMARETVSKNGVPIIPGSDGPIENEKEATKAFGNGALYVEKYLEDPRHIEFQVLADKHGNVIHLGERDCSVQRRHQKVIEEAPSPFLDKNLRARMGKAAIKATQAADYVNAGTIEFLVDAKGNFYFIEMNTRIQVEHAVTEEVTGIDLIKEQINIASGNRLSISQKEVSFNKHAIECRICAENPANGFTPSPGTIGLYYAPGGHGVRVDSHVYGGYTVSPYYDSMIAKLITYGSTRKIALDRMYRALSEYLIRGIDTNIEFLKAIVLDPGFRQGEATTSYVAEFLARAPKDVFKKTQ